IETTRTSHLRSLSRAASWMVCHSAPPPSDKFVESNKTRDGTDPINRKAVSVHICARLDGNSRFLPKILWSRCVEKGLIQRFVRPNHPVMIEAFPGSHRC